MIRVEWLCLLNLMLIGLLPRLLFRKGRPNAQWWLTAGPFLIAAAVQIASLTGWLQAVERGWRGGRGGVVAALVCASLLLIAYTLGTHRQRIPLWHQRDQQSAELVTWGAYAIVRHPLYTAFQLTLVACALSVPNPLSALALAGGLIQMHRTARLEEGRLAEAWPSYNAYARRVGRFWPRL